MSVDSYLIIAYNDMIYILVFLDWYQTSTSSQSAIYLDYYTKHYVHICIRSDFVKSP